MAAIVFVLDQPVKPPSRTVQSVTTFGVHTGLQNTTIDELRDLWVGAEQLGFDAVSVWDHLYSSDLTGYECHEAVAAHTALACSTTSVRVGCLVYCAGYRPAGVLAKAVTTVDHLSGGRAEVGLGAGWAQVEYEAFGIPFPPLGARLDLLDEYAAGVRALLRDESTTLAGDHVALTDARNEPRPVQADLPIWVGGTGERRTARIVAAHADGWNLPFVPPDALAGKQAALAEHCSALGRDPGEIRLGVNVIVSDDEASFGAQFGPRVDAVRPGAVIGTSTDHLTDALGRYVAAGADTVNVALRAPWNPNALVRAATAVAALR
jgi:alkanesulfonate monooxygenase SsuD/methylene tetrahydromethanopterin reductase-like flavin-dependent oxidoreductase (luciferase family)